MTAWLLHSLIYLPVAFSAGWALCSHRVHQRESARDEYRYLMAPIIPHSVEDASRKAGC